MKTYEDLLVLPKEEVAKEILSLINEAQVKAAINDWKIKGEIPKGTKGFLGIGSKKPEEAIVQKLERFPSWNAYKYAIKSVYRASKKKTRRSFNFMFWILDIDVKLEKSDKELVILEKKRKWKKAQAEAEKLLAEYKEEKGDYFKNILNQQVSQAA